MSRYILNHWISVLLRELSDYESKMDCKQQFMLALALAFPPFEVVHIFIKMFSVCKFFFTFFPLGGKIPHACGVHRSQWHANPQAYYFIPEAFWFYFKKHISRRVHCTFYIIQINVGVLEWHIMGIVWFTQ